MQMLVKTNLSLTNKSKKELFIFSNTLKNETTSYAHENFPFFSNTQILLKQTFFFKRDFFKIYKALKTIEKSNLEIYKF